MMIPASEYVYRWDLAWHRVRPQTLRTMCGRAVPVYAVRKQARDLGRFDLHCSTCSSARAA